MRRLIQGYLKDSLGNIIQGASYYVYKTGTTNEANIYTTLTSSTPATQPLTTDASGKFSFYVSDLDYGSTQLFDIYFPSPVNTTFSSVKGETILTTYDITSNTTVSYPIKIPYGVVFNISSGVTLTINGVFEAGLYQVFSGDGSVSFGSGSVAEVYSEWFGAKGDGVTDDSDAINNCCSSMPSDSVLRLISGKTYKIESTIVLPNTITLNITGATILSHHSGSALSLGTSGTLIGHNAEIYNDVDIAVGLITTTSKASVARIKIVGFPYIHNGATARNAGSIGIDGEVFYDSYIEAEVRYFEKGIVIGGGTKQSYYNVINGIKAYGNKYGIYASKTSSYTSALTILSPWISGALQGLCGIVLNGTINVNIVGGYLEGFDAGNTDTKGIYLIDAKNISIDNVTLDSSSSVANHAIYAEGACNKVSFRNIVVGGGWVSSSKVLHWSAVTGDGRYSFDGCSLIPHLILKDEWQDFEAIWTGGATASNPSQGMIKGNKIVGTQYNIISNNFVSFDRKIMYEQVTITASSSISTTTAIPSLSRLIGVVFRVDEALATGENWDAAYSGGSTLSLATSRAVAKNTTHKVIHEAHTDPLVTTSNTYVTITKSGGGNFTAQGKISIAVVYEWFEALATAP